jgi:UDPglucose 6-dehydrogenase
LREVDAINLRRRDRVVELVLEEFGGEIAGRRITVLGLAFKPDSDDVRDAPGLDVARRLVALGADVVATDPEAVETARRAHPGLHYEVDLVRALEGAEIVVLATEWAQYRELDPAEVRASTAAARIIDGRNCLDPIRWRDAGWTYRGLGRP